MGLTCIPKTCSCGVTSQGYGLRKGYTHAKEAPCPFAAYDFPQRRFGTCCSIKSGIAQSHLYALNEDFLAARFDYPMTAEQAAAFAQALRQAMDRLEEQYPRGQAVPEGAGQLGYWHKNRTEYVFRRRSAFAEAVAAVREAATWLELVAGLAFGVSPR